MMRDRVAVRVAALFLALALAALPAAADKVFVDYDHDVDFSRFETFTYAPVKKGLLAQDEQLDGWIVDGIVEHIVGAGLTRVEAEDEPDLVVSYALTTHTEGRWDVTGVTPVGPVWDVGWGWGPGFAPGWGYSGGWYVPTTMRTTYRFGSLVVAAYDVSTKLGVWRATAEIKEGKTPHKTHQKVDKALDRISEKWREMHRL